LKNFEQRFGSLRVNVKTFVQQIYKPRSDF
jgi:hypothetical protein